ncbi:MAG: tyrosine-type recombinase/integrase [Bacteroidales bacterium]
MKPIVILGREKKNGTKPVYLQLIINRERVKVNTQISVLESDWDAKKSAIKGKGSDVHDNNLIISQGLSRINQIMIKYRLRNKELTAELFLKEYSHPSYDVDFLSWMENEIKIKKHEVGPRRIIKYNTILNKLKEYRNPIIFSEIDHFFIENFRGWLKGTKENDINTVAGNLAVLKSFTTRALRKELIEQDPFEDIKIGRGTTDRTFCTEKELLRLWKIYEGDAEKPLKPHQVPVLRHYLFMCFTGLRISDFNEMTFDNVVNRSLRLYPVKTRSKKKQMVKIPLCEQAQKLILDEGNLTGKLFNPVSEQRMNTNMKDIAALADIKKPLTNHSARHTFATLFIQKTSDVATLQRLLGHSRIDETMVYVHITEENLFKQMKLFGDSLKVGLLPTTEKKSPSPDGKGDQNQTI